MIFATVYAPSTQGHIRPVDPGRDMGAIADLIEVSFSRELDRSGSGLVADMRQLAALGPLLTIVDRVSPVGGGYVWEEGGRVVGNATMTLEDAVSRRWFVSNVAVHPTFQGRGIAGQLMAAVLAGIRRQGGRQVLLQVRTDNEPAQRLYRRLRFDRYDTIAELVRPGLLPVAVRPQRLAVRRLRGRDWPALQDLTQAAMPPRARQVRALGPQALRPSLGKRLQEWLDGLLVGRQSTRWGVEEGSRLLAVVSLLVEEGSAPARLDLAVRPEARGQLEGALADVGLAALGERRPRAVAASISTSHPEALQALRERHFTAVRSLDQLALDLAEGA